MPRLAVYLLGPLRVTLDGEPVRGFISDKARALLAYLAVEAERRHRRESLAGLLWPDYPEPSARASLRSALANVRQVIGDRTAQSPFLCVDRQTLQFNPEGDAWVDVTAFSQLLANPPTIQQLEAAVDDYQGPFLDGFSLADSPAFEEWALLAREQLQRQALTSLGRLVDHYERNGDAARALPYARRQVELAPWREDAQRGLMRLLAQSGQRGTALAQYEALRRLLLDELGMEPALETTALFARIRAGETPMPGPAQSGTLTTPPHNLPAQTTPLIGRETELDDLDQLIADPDVRLVTIFGPGGIGKTHLALVAAERQMGKAANGQMRKWANGQIRGPVDPTGVARKDGRPTDGFSDGVYFVPLAALNSAGQIVPTLAEALRFQFQTDGRRSPRQQILDYLREKRMLLILDNFEHLITPSAPHRGASPPEGGIEGGTELLTEILRAAPHAQIVATSRERLRLQSEQVYALEGLAYPGRDAASEAAHASEVTEYPAVKLFLYRARRARHDFQWATEDLIPLSRICALVEGMPLAIQLAASWVDMLSLADIADQVASGTGGGLDFLGAEWQDVPQRHRSMRAVLETAWRQLDAGEREIYPQLSVFRAGFSRQAAHQVMGASLRVLTRLAHKSLLVYDSAQDRYQVHELLRQFGAEKLAGAPEAEATARDRHSAFFCSALGRWEGDLTGPRIVAALEEMTTDYDNVRAAWEWATAQGNVASLDQALGGYAYFFRLQQRHKEGIGACALAIDGLSQRAVVAAGHPDGIRVLATAMVWQAQFNLFLGQMTTARALLERAKELLSDPALAAPNMQPARAMLLRVMGRAAVSEERARELYEQAVALYRSAGDRRGEAWALSDLGDVCLTGGDLPRAQQSYKESLALHRARQDPWSVPFLLAALSRVAVSMGEYEEAQRLCDESLAYAEVSGIQWTKALLLITAAEVYERCGDYDTARRQYEAGLALARAQGDRWTMITCLNGLGQFAKADYEAEEATQRFSEAVALSQALGYELGVAINLSWLGHTLIYQGRSEAAVDVLRQSVTLFRKIGRREIFFALYGLGYALCQSGEFSAARAPYAEALMRAEEMQYGVGIWLLTNSQANLETKAGRYERGLNLAQKALALAHQTRDATFAFRSGRELSTTREIATSHEVLGWARIARKQYAQARATLKEGLSLGRSIGDRINDAFTLAPLGRAAYGLGYRAEARAHILEGLEIALEVGHVVPLRHLMPIIAVVLAGEEDDALKERAVELYALAESLPFVAKAQLFEDVAGQQVAAVAATLPPEVAATAQERGRALDWWETAAELIEELRALGWARSD